MNYQRVSELYYLLDNEYKKTPINQKRIAEVNYYLGDEFSKPSSFWSNFYFPSISIPSNWKIYVTALIGIAVALNSQFQWVPQSVQDQLLAVAVALGVWAAHGQQTQIKKLQTDLMLTQKKEKHSL